MLFEDLMRKLEKEAKALRDGRGSRIDWRLLTLIYALQVGSYENLCPLLLDLSRRIKRKEKYSPNLMEEFEREFKNFLARMGEACKRFLRKEMATLRTPLPDDWWWTKLKEVLI
ncbi:MAG: hypothetical protein GXO39_06595 [Thermotogae bacterium]|nr:hypothetical protein [Thermotogota bacterium]